MKKPYLFMRNGKWMAEYCYTITSGESLVPTRFSLVGLIECLQILFKYGKLEWL